LDIERQKTARLEDDLLSFQRRSREDDEGRDQEIRRAKREIQALADRVDEINKPRTQAQAREAADVTAATTTTETINTAFRWEPLKKAAIVLALAILYLLHFLGIALPKTEPNVSLPDTRPRQAEPGVQH